MPLNWNDQNIPSKADKTTTLSGFKETCGVGQLIYHPFRFKKYHLGNNSGNYSAMPICRAGYEPIFPNDDFLKGKELLVSLCNLAMQINSHENEIPYDKLIVQWCLKNMHPYNINLIYTDLNKDFDINSVDAEMVEQNGIFEINQFLNDLGTLYHAVMFYVSLEGICVADDETAYDLSKEGNCSNDNLVENLRSTLIDIIPDFTMKLKVDTCTNRLDFSIDVNSVFDIAWFTLAQMLSEYPAPEDKGKPDNRPEGIMIRCRNCGKFIIKKSNRQEFCDAEECQKARNARKQKAYRDRKAIESRNLRMRGNGQML